ncbi:hypothetical protein J2X69_003234 [Algoriphagus sp. 4150]|uniref:DUF6089 family protein n=1 Tax=Algoriphagus sp. 4150 TaxID=2817756 RepID=UPI00285C1B61|nr:DUF6089 family protein [Algoriphagus sp. 4150]MDR7130875.1 hypothetical protein [Algoriphagus sp. 4150]
MKKIFFTFLFLASLPVYSQSFDRFQYEEAWSFSVSAGATQYFGELYSFWKYNEGIQPEWNANIAAHYTFGTHLRARADFSYIKMSGQDPPSDPRANRIPRNLHFRAKNWEVTAMLEYYWSPVKVPNIHRSSWNPYIFAGVGMSTNNPKAQLDGRWVDLRPLKLENNPYNRNVVVFPMGLGLKYKLNVYMDLTLEGNYRFTMTDYLDDISAYNISEFYLDLVDDYVTGNNPDRLRLAVRNPNFLDDNGLPDVDKILRNGGRIRRGSGLKHRYDGYMTVNLGVEIYLAPDIWDNFFFRNRVNEKAFRFW